jgi:hypothetical protein
MGNESHKVSCLLEGDSAIDFERLSMVFKVAQYGQNRPKQQAIMIGVAMLVLDAVKQQCVQQTGKRYPSLIEVLKFIGISDSDIHKALGRVDMPGDDEISSLAAAIANTAPQVSNNSGK